MKKILFLALHLGYGGVERAIISEANMLAEEYDVEIACAYKLYGEPPFPVDKRVKITYLSETIKPNKDELKAAIVDKKPLKILKEGIISLRVLYYRKAAMAKKIKNSRADIIISTRYLYNALLAKNKQSGVIAISQEHNHHNNDVKYVNQIVQSLKGIDYFMPVSKELTEFYAQKLKTTVCKYIPHSLESIPEVPSDVVDPILVSVGRLSPEKGYLDLIEVYSMVHKFHPEWRLHIVGDGDERLKLEHKVKEYGLEDYVVLHGYQKKDYIDKILERASIYVMCSFSESFGIVLIEAQAYGIPCLAFDSARGALEIIEHGINGYIVQNRDLVRMSEMICRLIEDETTRQKFGVKSRENALSYSKESIKKQWIDFIEMISA